MAFKPLTRADGRTNSDVLLNYVKGAVPDTLFAYSALAKELSDSTDKWFSREEVQRVVNSSLNRLLKEQSRTLINIRNQGYKLARADEHQKLAVIRKRKSDKQLGKGLMVLKNVKWNEMSEASRQAHEGSLMIMSALHANQTAFDKRMNAIEKALKSAGVKVAETA